MDYGRVAQCPHTLVFFVSDKLLSFRFFSCLLDDVVI
jgi:hypothetical protein